MNNDLCDCSSDNSTKSLTSNTKSMSRIRSKRMNTNNTALYLLYILAETIFSIESLNLVNYVQKLFKTLMYALWIKMHAFLESTGLVRYIDTTQIRTGKSSHRKSKIKNRSSFFNTVAKNQYIIQAAQYVPLAWEIYSLAYHGSIIYRMWMLLNMMLTLLTLAATIWDSKKIIRILCFVAPLEVDDFDLHQFVKACGAASIIVGKLFLLRSLYIISIMDIMTGVYVINRTHKNIMKLLHKY